MKKHRLLIVDDDISLRTALFKFFQRLDYQVITASSLKEAKNFSGSQNIFDLAIIDLSLQDGSGLELVKHIRQAQPQCILFVLTGHATIETAIQSTQLGVNKFLSKPFELDELKLNVESALTYNMSRPAVKMTSGSASQTNNLEIIGESESIVELKNLISKVSDTDSTVLITGESGTGKELIARSLHEHSSRKKQPFVAINCGAIPAELLESELFGHSKGAFTGAVASRIGRFEMADGGTIFLDEIGDLAPALQVKLLRVLQERSFEPVGSTKSIQVDVRVLAATNKNLDDLVKKNLFREDLYYRLNVIPIQVSALRERPSDIPILLGFFMDRMNAQKRKNLTGFSVDALSCLEKYSWPGNIRELENLIERLTILKGFGEVQVSDLPSKCQMSLKSGYTENINTESLSLQVDFNTAVDQFENALILRALEKTNWNRNQAAQMLGLNRTTLVEKIKKKGLRPPDTMVVSSELDTDNRSPLQQREISV
jgi:DNA-binding NtrC family response regulator